MPATQARGTEPFAPSPHEASKLEDVRKLLDTIEGRGATPQSEPVAADDGPVYDNGAAAITSPVTAKAPRRTTQRRKGTNMALNQAPTQTQTAPASAQPAGSNVPDLGHYLAKAEELGQKAGEGRNVGQTMIVELLTGGYLGGLTFEPRQGKEEGDHAEIAQRYASKQALANRNDPKASNMKKLKSDFGLAIKTGQNPKFGMGQPLEVTNQYIALLDKQRKRQVAGLQDTYNGLLRLWRAMNKTGSVPANDRDLEPFCFKAGARPITVDRALEMARKTLQRISQGKLPNCDEMDDSKEVKDAVAAITKRLATRAKLRQQQAAPAPQQASQAA